MVYGTPICITLSTVGTSIPTPNATVTNSTRAVAVPDTKFLTKLSRYSSGYWAWYCAKSRLLKIAGDPAG